jgi:1-acyl-sn-glycerol-3-phosphate acyltransferase
MKSGRLGALIRAAIHLAVLRPLVRLYCGVHVAGSAHLQQLRRFIIIANHNSHLDVFLLFSLLSARDIALTHPVADETYFARFPIVFALVRFLFQPVWIRRGHPDRNDDPLRGLKDLLDRGHNLVVFPEGTRGRPGELQAFKSGLGRLVSEYPGVPIVPVFLSGPERVLPKSSVIPLPFWSHVLVGPPQVCIGSPRDITHHLQNTLCVLSQSGVIRRRPRQRRLQRHQPAPAVAILGIDGSGKSTVSRRLAQHLSTEGNACLVSDRLEFFENGEPKPLQPLGLEAARGLVGRYAKRARSLAHYKIPKLTELLLRDRLLAEVNRWYAPRIIVLDGSPLLNIAAWAVLYRKEHLDDDTLAKAIAVLAGDKPGPRRTDPVFAELPELRQLDRLGLTHLGLPRLMVLLDLPPELACARVAARGGPRQPHETEEKLGSLREAYRRVLRITAQKWNIPALTVDGTQPPDDAAGETLRFVRNNLEQNYGQPSTH